jgi:SPP1 family predicted phage head-tail adaptor
VSAPAIAELRHEIVIEARTRSPDAGGGAELGWTPLATVWAAIRPRSGREIVSADQVVSSVTHEIWIRHRTDVTAEMRFSLGARRFGIDAVLEAGERGQWLRCPCREEPA